MIYTSETVNEDFENYLIYIREIFSALNHVEHRYLEKRNAFLLTESLIKAANVSILIDSFSPVRLTSKFASAEDNLPFNSANCLAVSFELINPIVSFFEIIFFSYILFWVSNKQTIRHK